MATSTRSWRGSNPKTGMQQEAGKSQPEAHPDTSPAFQAGGTAAEAPAMNDEIGVRGRQRRRDWSSDDEYWQRRHREDPEGLRWWCDDPGPSVEQESRAGFEERLADSDGLYGPANLPADVDPLVDDIPHPGGAYWQRLLAGEAWTL